MESINSDSNIKTAVIVRPYNDWENNNNPKLCVEMAFTHSYNINWLASSILFCMVLLCAYIKRQLWDCCQFKGISSLMMTKIVFGSQSIDKQGGTVIENRISINPWLTFHWFPMLLTTVRSSFKDGRSLSLRRVPRITLYC